jgi:hypothetical protein
MQVEAAARLRKLQSFIARCEAGERRVDVLEWEDFVKNYGWVANDLLPVLRLYALPVFPGGEWSVR